MREPSSGTAVQDGGRPSPGAAQDPDGAVVCAGLTKDYGQGRGVFDLDLTIRRGETFGFVGPNGAGKTTTIRLLMDLIRPDRGTATTLGRDPLMQREFRGLVGEAAARGATVLLSSHLLAEVELICDRIGMIREGRLLRVGSIEELRTVRVHRVEAIVRDQRDVAELARIPGVTDAEINGELGDV